jgi:tRNA modification GTPase
LAVSGVTGEGLGELRAKIAEVAETEIIDLGGSVAIGGRHRAALERALGEIGGCDVSRPELAAERVRWAIRAIEEMIGAVDTEEVLDEVFSTFCIGK